METIAARLQAIRRRLAETGDAAWADLLDGFGDETPSGAVTPSDGGAAVPSVPIEGALVALHGVDPTRQCGEGDTRFIVHSEGGHAWAIRLDRELHAMVRRLRELQATFGFPREETWDLVGRFVDVEAGVGEWALGHETGLAVIRPRAFRVARQLALVPDAGGELEVPGLAAATQALEALHQGQRIPVAREPRELLPIIADTLETNNWPLFRRLWTEGTTDLDLHYRFDQFRKAFNAAGALHFDRYDGDTQPLKARTGDIVKMFVRRELPSGRVYIRPLLVERTTTTWRLRAGVL